MSKYYYFKVHTADQVFAGTDSNIFVTLYGEKGQSRERRLNGWISGNAFERNQTDIFKVEYDKDCGNIYRIELRSDNMYVGSAWLCDYIDISATEHNVHSSKKQTSRFTLGTGEWINDDKIRVLDAVEGYNFKLINTEVKERELLGEIIHIPPFTKYTHELTYEERIDINYQEINITNIETNFTEEIDAQSVKVVFNTKIISELNKQYGLVVGVKKTEKRVFEFSECETQRNLRSKYVIKDYGFDAYMQELKFHFRLPDYKIFTGFVDDKNHVDTNYQVLNESISY